MLKQFLIELPDPLLTKDGYEGFIEDIRELNLALMRANIGHADHQG